MRFLRRVRKKKKKKEHSPRQETVLETPTVYASAGIYTRQSRLTLCGTRVLLSYAKWIRLKSVCPRRFPVPSRLNTEFYASRIMCNARNNI